MSYFSKPHFNENIELKGVDLMVPKGASLMQITDSLYKKQIISDKDSFIFWVKSLGYETKLRAGYFHIPKGLNSYQLVKYLSTTREITFSITLLEGWTYKRIGEEFQHVFSVNAAYFDSLCRDRHFIHSLGLDVPSLEGYLLPNTYLLSPSAGAKHYLSFLTNKTLSLFDNDSVKMAMKEQNLTQHEVLTLASIVEGEAVLDSERRVIASLYLNRLKKNMLLQADPTIQYIISGEPRRLLLKDLQIDSPYNTYRNKGLPPGPINNPGKASIMAVLFPAKTKYLYMVAVGDGSHAFSNTLREHLKAKAAFDKVRREVDRKKRLNQ